MCHLYDVAVVGALWVCCFAHPLSHSSAGRAEEHAGVPQVQQNSLWQLSVVSFWGYERE